MTRRTNSFDRSSVIMMMAYPAVDLSTTIGRLKVVAEINILELTGLISH